MKEIDLFGEPIPTANRGRDWTGNRKGVFSIIGASNHSLKERQSEDFYATEPRAVEMLCDLEKFSPTILEPSAGHGHIAEVLKGRGYNVIARDLYDRGYGESGHDFLKCTERDMDYDIITNPPYKYAQEFVEKSLEVVREGHKVAMFLKLTFLEGKNRRTMFERTPPPCSIREHIKIDMREEWHRMDALLRVLCMVCMGEGVQRRSNNQMV